MSLTPLMAQALQACAKSPDRRLRRTRGGYVATGSITPVFTKRLVNMLDRGYYLQVEGEFADSATLTRKGEQAVLS